MFIQKKSIKVLVFALITAMSMSVFLPAAAKEKKITVDMPEGCGEVIQHATLGFLLGVTDGAVRTFTSAYLNQALFSKWLGKSLGTVGASLLTHGCFELAQRMLMTPKATTYNTAYYTGLIPTTVALTPELARHKETITKIGDSVKETSSTIAKWILNLCTKGINKLNNMINKTNKKEVAKVATKSAKEVTKVATKTVDAMIQSKAV